MMSLYMCLRMAAMSSLASRRKRQVNERTVVRMAETIEFYALVVSVPFLRILKEDPSPC